MKKGQGMSMNLIIIAVLALIVLALLVFIVGKYSMKFRTGTQEAESSICLTKFNRTCVEATSCTGNYVPAAGVVKQARDCGEKEICCERK